ncbi:MAG: transposase [Candidatus Riflebacteria bacterium]|nr:transposase [Candidatus Riflebacteria bacterium]
MTISCKTKENFGFTRDCICHRKQIIITPFRPFLSLGKAGAVVVIQIFGDLLAFHPHCHILVTDRCFQRDQGFLLYLKVESCFLSISYG